MLSSLGMVTLALQSSWLGQRMVNDTSNSLWESLLKESSKRTRQSRAVSTWFGDINVGKNSVISKFCTDSTTELSEKEQTSVPGIRSIKEILSYSYLDVDDVDSDSYSRVDIWSVNDKTFDESVENVVRPLESDKVRHIKNSIRAGRPTFISCNIL